MTSTDDRFALLSRRALLRLGAASGAVAGAATLGLPTLAAAAPSVPASGWKPTPGAKPAVSPLAPVPPNTVMNVVGIGDWAAYNGDLTPAGAAGQFSNGAGGFMVAALDIPPGALPFTLSAFGTSVSGQAWTVFVHDVINNTFTVIATATSAGGINQFVNISLTSIGTLAIYQRVGIIGVPSADVNNFVNGVGYFYIPANPAFHTISPARAYDSRLHDGPISSGQTRTISVAMTTGGAALVPQGASAVVYNLTVADTVSMGFLGLFPAGTTWPGNSSINWFTANELDANGGIVALGGDRQINVICGGGGSTNFIVDVTGFFL